MLILIDDAGFGQPDTFGGPVATPNLTRVGQMGLTYNRFHVVALCSPTRAATLTGRNQHRVGMGSVAEFPGPFPGYTGAVPKSCAAVPRILKENGYVTGGFGKWHMTPDREQGAAGPFEHWPQNWGFNHFWGFLSGAAGQWDPLITQDNTNIGVPEGTDGKPYYFPDDLTDKSVEWLHAVRAQDPEKPWFLYYSTGCAHAPHHVAKEWADKYKGKFDQGWDAIREEVFERQKKLGVIPQDAVLTERPDLFDAWDSLDDASKKLYTRQMEVYAGFMDNADWNVGRLLDEVEEMGDLDNTLIFYIWGDNGASLEGTTTGSFNEMTFLNGVDIEPKQQLELIDKYGGIDAWGNDHTAPHIAAAWAWAGNTPFQWGKQMASHLGGTRNPMVVAWPTRIKAGGDLRSQFTHCIDIGPTILEAAGIPEPKVVDGIEQEPMDGTSFLYTFDDADAEERHTVQYFEVIGSRAIYKDGWWACARLDKKPWEFSPAALAPFAPGKWDPEQDTWELYYLPDDFTQAKDVAAENPEKLAELKELFWAGGGAQPRAAAARLDLRLLRHPPAAADRDPLHVRGRRPEHPEGPRAPDRRTLVRDRGGARDPRGRRRGRDPRQRRLHRRLRALGGRGGQAQPHLLVPGRRELQADVDQAASDRRRHGEDAVRGRRAEAGQRRQRHALGQRRADRRRPHREDRADDAHVVRRHGREPRQRPRRRPRLRGQGAVPVHGNGQEGRLRPEAAGRTTTRRRCTSTRASTPSRTEWAPRKGQGSRMNHFTITRSLDASPDRVWEIIGNPGTSPGRGVDVRVERPGIRVPGSPGPAFRRPGEAGPASGGGRRGRVGPEPGACEQATHVDDQLPVDVLAVRHLEKGKLVAQLDLDLPAVLVDRGAGRLEERKHLTPFDVGARRVREELLEGVAVPVLQPGVHPGPPVGSGCDAAAPHPEV